MYAVLPLSVVASAGHTEAPPPPPAAATLPGWGNRLPQGTPGERRRVTIYRESLDTPWGFRLQGGKELNTPLSVKRVFSGSPAYGHLVEDDLVLAIDDRPVDGLSSAEILDVIKLSGLFIVLNIETGLYDSAFDSKPESIRDTAHFQKPVHHTEPTKQAAITSDADFQRPSAFASYEKYFNRPTASTYQPSVTAAQGRQRPRFQATAQATHHGQLEPGWTPKLNPTAAKASPPATTAAGPPAAQHRSARQHATKPQASGDAQLWSSPYSAVEEPEVPAWYGSLRSNRAPHSWEVRAARVQSPVYEPAPQSVPTEPALQSSAATGIVEPEPTRPKEVRRTYKTEIRGLVLSRPAYQHAHSTPEWGEDTSVRQCYYTSDQTQSAPATPSADTFGGAVDSPAAETGSHPVAAPAAQEEEEDNGSDSAAVRIQPSVLFGHVRSVKAAPSPSQSREAPAAQQPREVKVTLHLEHAREERKASGAQPVVAPKVQQPAAKQQVPTLPVKSLPLITGIVERFNPVPDRPQKEILIQKQLRSAIERFNPTPDRPETLTKVSSTSESHAKATEKSVERFNPTPDRPEKQLAKVSSTSESHAKATEKSVERFNPTPDRPEKLARVGISSTSESQVKITEKPVERFNPTPDRKEATAKSSASHTNVKSLPTTTTTAAATTTTTTTVERFNPTPDKQEKPTKPLATQKLPSTRAASTCSQRSAAGSTKPTTSPAPIERFNPTPDRPQVIVKAKAPESFLKAPPERFNPTPDAPVRPPRTTIERFNPVPDRP